ncbi:hypothetical protein V3C99_017112 [Haemonchus contortus]
MERRAFIISANIHPTAHMSTAVECSGITYSSSGALKKDFEGTLNSQWNPETYGQRSSSLGKVDGLSDHDERCRRYGDTETDAVEKYLLSNRKMMRLAGTCQQSSRKMRVNPRGDTQTLKRISLVFFLLACTKLASFSQHTQATLKSNEFGENTSPDSKESWTM